MASEAAQIDSTGAREKGREDSLQVSVRAWGSISSNIAQKAAVIDEPGSPPGRSNAHF